MKPPFKLRLKRRLFGLCPGCGCRDGHILICSYESRHCIIGTCNNRKASRYETYCRACSKAMGEAFRTGGIKFKFSTAVIDSNREILIQKEES